MPEPARYTVTAADEVQDFCGVGIDYGYVIRTPIGKIVAWSNKRDEAERIASGRDGREITTAEIAKAFQPLYRKIDDMLGLLNVPNSNAAMVASYKRHGDKLRAAIENLCRQAKRYVEGPTKRDRLHELCNAIHDAEKLL